MGYKILGKRENCSNKAKSQPLKVHKSAADKRLRRHWKQLICVIFANKTNISSILFGVQKSPTKVNH